MSTSESPTPACPLCHVALRMRLGELECPQCGFVPPAAQAAPRGGALSQPAANAVPAGSRWSYFSPVHYSAPDIDTAGGALYFEKRLCYRIFVFVQLLPIFGLLAFAVFFTLMALGMIKDSAEMFSSMRSMFWLVWAIIALGIILWGLQAAVEILLLRWALFGTNALPKWGCLAVTGLNMLYSAYASFIMVFTGQLEGKPDEPLTGIWRSLTVVGIILLAVYQGWIVYILQREVMNQ